MGTDGIEPMIPKGAGYGKLADGRPDWFGCERSDAPSKFKLMLFLLFLRLFFVLFLPLLFLLLLL